jgi:hypothetical protein
MHGVFLRFSIHLHGVMLSWLPGANLPFTLVFQFLRTSAHVYYDPFQRKCVKVSLKGRAMVQAVSRRSLTAEAGVRSRVSPGGICGGESGTRTVFSRRSSVFLCQQHHHISSWDEQKAY